MMRIVDVLYSIPFIFAVIFVLAVLNDARGDPEGRTVDNETVFFVVIGAIYWLTMARVVRGQVLALKSSGFITAARAFGASTPRIFATHVLPNVMSIVVVYLTLTIPAVMLFEAFLSFPRARNPAAEGQLGPVGRRRRGRDQPAADVLVADRVPRARDGVGLARLERRRRRPARRARPAHEGEPMSGPLLAVKNLRVSFDTPLGYVAGGRPGLVRDRRGRGARNRRRVRLGQVGHGAGRDGPRPRARRTRRERRGLVRRGEPARAAGAAAREAARQAARDGVPGPDDVVEPVPDDRASDHRDARGPRVALEARGAGARGQVARQGRNLVAGGALRTVPPRAVRRHAPAGHDRDGRSR